MDAGVRYEYVGLPPAQHPNAALDAVFGNIARTDTLPADRNNFAPRAAIAWNASANTTLRIAYGVYFGRIPGATVRSALTDTAQPLSSYSLRITPRTIIDASCASAGTNFGYPATYACPPTGLVA